MEKRKVTVWLGGQPCRFYSDDSEEYLSTLAERANAVLSVLALTDALLRMEQRMQEIAAEKKEVSIREPAEAKRQIPRKTSSKAVEEDPGQVSVWDLLK